LLFVVAIVSPRQFIPVFQPPTFDSLPFNNPSSYVDSTSGNGRTGGMEKGENGYDALGRLSRQTTDSAAEGQKYGFYLHTT
jgi:hypothetical protein